MKGIGYKELYEASEKRWSDLNAYLMKAVEMADLMGDNAINFNKNTVLQILFQMNAMSPPSEDDE